MSIAATLAATAATAATAAPVAAEVGFFATVSGFVAGLLLTVPALIILVVLGVLSEHNGARGWAVFFGLVTAVVAYFFFSISLTAIAIGALAYLAVGLVWSFWRYKRHASKIVDQFKNENNHEKDRALRNLHPRNMISTITAWIFIWPFSMIESIAGDIITLVQELVKKVFRGVYQRIYDSAVSALTK